MDHQEEKDYIKEISRVENWMDKEQSITLLETDGKEHLVMIRKMAMEYGFRKMVKELKRNLKMVKE